MQGTGTGVPAPGCSELFDLDGGAGLFELRLDPVGLLAVDAFLDRVRSAVDEVLGLLEAKAGDRADDLDHLDLLAPGAREDDVERRLLLAAAVRSSPAPGGRRGNRDRSSSGDAPLLLDLVLQLDELENRHLPEVVENRVNRTGCHQLSSFVSSAASSVSPFSAVSSALGCSVAASAVAAGSSSDVSSLTGSSCVASAATGSSAV